MTAYKLELFFTNLDNFMGTDDEASVTMDIKSDTRSHAFLLAERMKRVFDADHYILEEAK